MCHLLMNCSYVGPRYVPAADEPQLRRVHVMCQLLMNSSYVGPGYVPPAEEL